MSEAPNPWTVNYFDPPSPSVPAPSPKAHTPRLVPEIDDLFTVQRDLLKALNAKDVIEHELKGSDVKGFRQLEQQLENAYKVINRYLKKYGQ